MSMKYIVKQTVTIVRTAEVEAVSAEDAGQVLANGMVGEKCAPHEWPSSVPMVEEFRVEGDCGITVHSPTLTCKQLQEQIDACLKMFHWHCIWDHTGGGCWVLTVQPLNDIEPDKIFMISHAEDTYGYEMADTPLGDFYKETWDSFMVCEYRSEDDYCEHYQIETVVGVNRLLEWISQAVMKECS